jgi:hypothetical protein
MSGIVNVLASRPFFAVLSTSTAFNDAARTAASEHRPSAEPPIVQSHQTENAAEFIDAIHDLAGNLGTEVFSGWRSRICYRGVASVAHRLVPTALRPEKHGALERSAGSAARFRVSDLKNKPQ